MVNRANEVATFIKTKRNELNISQKELSDKIGMRTRDGQFLSNVERGICQFPVRYVKQLAEALDVSEDTIVDLITSDYKKCILKALNESKTIN